MIPVDLIAILTGCAPAPELPPQPAPPAEVAAPADPCRDIRHWEGSTEVVCDVERIDAELAAVLAARPDRDTIRLYWKVHDPDALSDAERIPWVREVSLTADEGVVVDLRALAPLKGLRRLDTPITIREAADAWAFPEIERINIYDGGEIDFRGAATLERLTRLTVHIGSGDPAPLASVGTLEHLYLGFEVTDLTFLRGLPRLRTLSLRVRPGTDLTPLATLPALDELVIHGVRTDSLANALAGSSLTRLFLRDDPTIRDVGPLATLSSLELLNLSGTSVSDVAPLARLPRLKELMIFQTDVRSALVLASFPALEHALIPHQVSDAERAELRRIRPRLETR